MKKARELLRAYRRKLRRRKAEREHQIAEWKKTHDIGHAKQAHRRARQTRYLRRLAAKMGHRIRRIALSHREGIDFYGDGPTAAELKAEGKDFVVLYLGVATREEVAAYAAGGVDVVCVYERDNEAFLHGYDEGEAYAHDAQEAARELGVPKGRPIYFAADFEVQEGQLGACDSFRAGAEHVLDDYEFGAYGSLLLVEHLASKGLRWLWQTYAWSHHVWSPDACLRQYLIDLPENPLRIGGQAVDYDKSTKADFGQWRLGEKPHHHPRRHRRHSNAPR